MSKLLVPSIIVGLFLAVGTMAAACGGGEELTPEEYFQQVEAIANEQDEKSDAANERFDALEEGDFEGIRDVFAEVVEIGVEALDAIDDIDPPTEVEDAHNEFVDAGEAFMGILDDFVDDLADVETVAEFVAVAGIDDPEFASAEERFDAACVALEEIATENGIDVDLDCGA